MRLFLKFIFLLLSISVFAQQETIVKGRIMEKGKPEALPFVSVMFKGTKVGTTSNFDGYYQLKTTQEVDTLLVSYVGYKTKRIAVKKGIIQTINIQLETDAHQMSEIVVLAGENPAMRIIKKAQKNRAIYDASNLNSFAYDSYSKMDISMNNISEDMRNNVMLRPLKALFDTAHQMKNDEGKYILPLLITEVHSRFYVDNKKQKTKEVIFASNQNGFGVNQGSYLSEMLGASALQFNFNQNWIRILGKDFISPIATGSNAYYIYTLQDSIDIEGIKCYQIRLDLRREQDLGFIGTIWVADSSFALKRIDVDITPKANINFIDRLKIQQEMQASVEGPWVTEKMRVMFDIAQLTKNSSGFIAKLYRSNSKYHINQQHDDSFYDIATDKQEEENGVVSKTYWDSVRTEPFSSVEKQMMNMIDSVQNVPVVKTYVDVIRLITEGYYRKGKLDFGPYVFLIGYDEVESLRVRMGARTNLNFSNRWTLHGYLAYGTKDERLKYGVGAAYLISRKKWSSLSVFHKDDYDILGVTDFNPNTLQRSSGASNIFAAINLGVGQSRLNRTVEYRLNFMRQHNQNWSYRVSLDHVYFQPLGRFHFAYIRNPEKPETPDNVSEDYYNTSATIELRFAYKENMVVRNNVRFRLARSRYPELTMTFTQGLKGLLGGNFDYNKLQFNVTHHVTTGFLGNADYSITMGKTLGNLPYPLLDVPRGNATFFYNDINFSLMNLYEFVADEYSQFTYVQHFEGLFTNRIPLLRNWKLRNFAVIKVAYGHLTDANKQLLPKSGTDLRGFALSPVHEFKNEPYVEAAYGFENIFRLLSLSMVHRLTYLDNPNVRKWGINLGLKFNF
jgi:hypothetical protein